MQTGETTNTAILNVMKKSKTNFFYSSVFLSKPKREGLRVIYAFCRMTDDIVDNEELTVAEKSIEIKKWKERLNDSLYNNSDDPFFNMLREKIEYFKIPHKPFFDLIEGMEMDIVKDRYDNFDELYRYCYCAASSVGLMSIEIFGYRNEDIKRFAEYLGIALQLTNIIRDIKKDALNGRIYLPQEDLRKFNYSESDLKNSRYNEEFKKLLSFEFDRAVEYYRKADSFLKKEDKGYMLAARIMEHIYFDLLKKIKSLNYNVYENNVRIPKLKKLFWAYSVYFKYKLLYQTK